MLDAETIKLKARLLAIEFFIAKLFAAVTIQVSEKDLARLKQNHIDGLKRQTVPGVDAATADLLTSEFADAVMELWNYAEKIRKQGRKP